MASTATRRPYLSPMHADHMDVSKRSQAVCNALLAMIIFPMSIGEGAAKRETWSLGNADALAGRSFPEAYDGWSRALQKAYEDGRQMAVIGRA